MVAIAFYENKVKSCMLYTFCSFKNTIILVYLFIYTLGSCLGFFAQNVELQKGMTLISEGKMHS